MPFIQLPNYDNTWRERERERERERVEREVR